MQVLVLDFAFLIEESPMYLYYKYPHYLLF